MKKQQVIIGGISLFFLSLFSLSTASAQEIDTRIGGMLAYGTKIENIGIGANAEFGIIENLSISPSFIFYLPKKNGPVKTNWFELNANANYYFLSEDKFDVYGLAGLNYSQIKVKFDGPAHGVYGEGISASDGRVGLNIGGGANLNLDGNIIPFAEIKYVIIDGGQLVIAAGVKFNI